MKRVLTVAAVIGVTMAAQGQPKEYSGAGGPLVDFGNAVFEIVVPDHGEIASFESVTLLGFAHTWAGDLTITLTHEDTGTMLTLLDRPGVPESGNGDAADFAGDYTWQDGGFFYDSDVFGATVTESLLEPVGGSLTAFDSLDKFGTWSLTISDGAAADTGTLGGWSFVVNNIPGPGSLAVLGMAGLLGARRRRRRA